MQERFQTTAHSVLHIRVCGGHPELAEAGGVERVVVGRAGESVQECDSKCKMSRNTEALKLNLFSPPCRLRVALDPLESWSIMRTRLLAAQVSQQRRKGFQC